MSEPFDSAEPDDSDDTPPFVNVPDAVDWLNPPTWPIIPANEDIEEKASNVYAE